MRTAKKVTGRLASVVLPGALFVTSIALSALVVFGLPHRLEQALDKSGLYEAAVPAILAQPENSARAALGDIPTHDPGVQAAIEQAFPPSLLRQNAMRALDGGYAWLRGSDLAFRLDFTQAKTAMANNLAAYVARRAEALPTCTLSQLQNLVMSGLNPYTISCLPPIITAQAAAEQARQAILANQSFLPQTVITPTTLQPHNGRTLAQQLQPARNAYALAKRGVWAAGIISLLAIAGIVFAGATTRRGWRRAGLITLFSGGAIVLIAVFLTFLLNKAAGTLTAPTAGQATLYRGFARLVELLSDDVRVVWAGCGAAAALAGAAMLLGTVFVERQKLANREASPDATSVPPSAPPPAQATAKKHHEK